MPPAKKTASAATKTAAPAKGAAKKAAAPASKAAAPAKKAAAPAKKAVPAKAAPQATITLKHIAAELAEGHDLSKKAAEAVLDDFVAVVTRQLANGDKIRLSGLGILQVREPAGAHRAQSGDRRIRRGRGEQEDRVSTGQGVEGGGVARSGAGQPSQRRHPQRPVRRLIRGADRPSPAPADLS